MSEQITGNQARLAFIYAARQLNKEKHTLNQLNVFPVADQDTGTNMARSLELTAQALPSDGKPADIFQEAYLQLLEYAHGNSGTILTLFFEGFSYALPAKEKLSGRDLALAFARGAETAYSALDNPIDGTILSVARQSAAAGMSLLDFTEDAGTIFQRITQEAHASLLLTPLQNPILKKHRVVDSGAYGFCLILDGFLQSFAPEAPALPYPSLRLPVHAEETPDLLYRYCTEFVAELASKAQADELEGKLPSLGNCFLRVSREGLFKVHIHTNDPEKVLSIAEEYGTIRSKKVEDMTKIRS